MVGTIAQGIPLDNGTYAWTLGNYSVKICTEDNFYQNTSGTFKIW
jgi:hypothetical protein